MKATDVLETLPTSWRGGRTMRMKAKVVELLADGKDVMVVAHDRHFAEECRRDILTWAMHFGVKGKVKVTDVHNARYSRTGWTGAVCVDHYVPHSHEGRQVLEQLYKSLYQEFKKHSPDQKEEDLRLRARTAARVEWTRLLEETDGEG
jgi:hypothetical protein